jgi:hypothetical protein
MFVFTSKYILEALTPNVINWEVIRSRIGHNRKVAFEEKDG